MSIVSDDARLTGHTRSAILNSASAYEPGMVCHHPDVGRTMGEAGQSPALSRNGSGDFQGKIAKARIPAITVLVNHLRAKGGTGNEFHSTIPASRRAF
jgi:hypothetical protein